MTFSFAEKKIRKMFSGTVVVTIGLFINSVFGYLLQLFLGRTLTVEEFGTFNALLALFYLFGVFANVLSTSLIKVSAELFAKKNYGKLTSLFWTSSAYLLFGGAFIVLLLYTLRMPLAGYMNISQPILFFFLGLYILGNLLVVTPQAYLQGSLKFNAFALYIVIVGFLRLALIAFFVLLGYKVGGVYFGLGLSLALSYVVATLLLKKDFKYDKTHDLRDQFNKIAQFSFPVFVINMGMLAINNVDIILVKKYFDGLSAGYYAGVVTMGKIILFGAGSVTTVMFPQISALKTKGESYFDKFKFFLLLQLILAFGGLAAFVIFPRFITLLLFGNNFANSIQYLPSFAVFMTLYIVNNFLLMFLLAVERTKIALLLIPTVLLQFILINLFNNSLYTVININILVSVLLLVTLSLYLYKLSTSKK